MITALLAAVVIRLLFYGTLPSVLLGALSAGTGILLYLLRRHSHTHYLVIDVLAQDSRLNRVNPGLKFGTVLALLVICVSAPGPAVGIALFALTSALTVWIGGLELPEYVHLLTLPGAFLLVSGLALLVEVTGGPSGVWNRNLLGVWLCVTPQSQAAAALVMARALGGLGCLYLLSLSTPMPELVGVLRRMGCPRLIVSLMYLIYRYLFVLLSMHATMRDAAQSRLGYRDYPTGLRTTGGVYSQLLARSYRQANRNYDAMESRCFGEEIRFLEQRRDLRKRDVAACLCAVLLALTLLVLSARR